MTAIQTIEAHGILVTEYRYEPETDQLITIEFRPDNGVQVALVQKVTLRLKLSQSKDFRDLLFLMIRENSNVPIELRSVWYSEL